MPNRRGFTLVETLVALLLFQFAMLALVAASAVAARDLATARRVELAHMVARNRAEQLASSPCPAPGAGITALRELIEHWHVVAAGDRRRISDSVTFPRPDGRSGFVVVRSTALCRR